MNKTSSFIAPDFYVVGAAKAGTTAIWSWLRQHDHVYLPQIKEPGYFAFSQDIAIPKKGPYDPDYSAKITTDADAYRALYAGAGGRMTGDASPVYLGHRLAAQLIAQARPDARIIVILRHPVDRAFSQYLHHRRDGLEPCKTFEDALAAEESRLAEGWSWAHGYAALGEYSAQIDRFLAVFPRDQILFLEYEALQSDPKTCWDQICAHLGLEPRSITLSERVNATHDLRSVPGRPGISRILKHPGGLQKAVKKMIPPQLRTLLRRYLEGAGDAVPTLSNATRARLAHRYSQEIPQLEAQTGLQLDHWKM